MSGIDVLREATVAVRHLGERSGDELHATRARILLAVAARRRRRRRRAVAALSVGLLLSGSSVWAAATGRLAPLVRAVVAAVTRGRALPWHDDVGVAAPALSAPRRPAPPAAVAVTSTPSPESRAQAAPSPPVHLPSGTVPSPSGPSGNGSRARRENHLQEGHEEEELTFFKAAHRIHFSQHDPAAALAAWDRYLRFAPDGRFALEARYDRAVCLVRLGRHAEAVAALRPFADGALADYRRRDARRLIEALAGSSGENEIGAGGHQLP